MNELRLSAHSLGIAACPWRYYMYRVLKKVPAEVVPARVQGIAGHVAIALWRKGASKEEQEKAIDAVFTEKGAGIPAEDYRTPGYLKQVLEQYRAEHAPEKWQWLEVEQPFEVELGFVGDCRVIWTGRRDAVGLDLESGRRYVTDEKFVSRDESAEYASAQNSCALKGYCWDWNFKHPSEPVVGAILHRNVIRGPTKAAPLNFSFPPDPPILFPRERLDEWREHVLQLAKEIAHRDPARPEDWPMREACCRHTFGCCDYLKVCVLPPGEDRLRMLGTDLFTERIYTDHE